MNESWEGQGADQVMMRRAALAVLLASLGAAASAQAPLAVETFDAAWRISDRVRLHGGVARHFRQVWKRAPIAGQRVLVRCHHGDDPGQGLVDRLLLLRRQAAELEQEALL